jgi:hypothetical protein
MTETDLVAYYGASAEQQERYDKAATEPGKDYVEDADAAHVMGMDDKSFAKYKIEIMFGPKRTVTGPNTYVMQVFESGKRLHGGGDELAYWCKDVREGHDEGCWGIIIGDWIRNGIAFCPHCDAGIRADYLTGQRFGKITTQALAAHVTAVWRQLDCSADIYCKFDRDDIRIKIMEEKVGAADAHRLRGLFIYPLPNILKDTAAGASVEARFEAFFKA